MPLNPIQARVVDPVLSTVARGYLHTKLASTYLFPVVNVAQRGGKVIQFGDEAFAQYATGRAPGANLKRVTFGYQGVPYALEQNALSGVVPQEIVEEAAAGPSLAARQIAVKNVMRIIALGVERKAAKLATASGNYSTSNKIALSGADRWSNEASDPASQMDTAFDAIETGVGISPNLLVLGRQAFRALRRHPDVKEKIKYTSSRAINEQVIADFFGVERVVVPVAKDGKKGAFKDVWGNVAILAYTEIGNLASMGTPSYGYTYRLENYPLATSGRFDDDTRSWVYDVVTEDTPVIAGPDAGYLFTNVA